MSNPHPSQSRVKRGLRSAVLRAMELSWPVVRPAVFQMDAEAAHHLTLRGLQVAQRAGLAGWLPPVPEAAPVTVCGLRFPNRVGLAAGLDKAGECVDGFGALGFGFVEIGTVTPRGQPGNPRPRLFRFPAREAVLNRMGFNNPGIEQVTANAAGRQYRGILGVNLGKNADTPNERAADDYLAGLRAAWPWADYVTVNLSSPNTRGLRDLQEAEACRSLIRTLRAEQEVLAQKHGRHVPVWIKIAPDLTGDHLRALATVFVGEKLEGVIATNTTLSRRHVESWPRANEPGGVSGAPLSERSTQVIRMLVREMDGAVPVIGVGGIMSAADAVAKMEAGAVLVQLYTGLIYRGPALVRECIHACAAAVQ